MLLYCLILILISNAVTLRRDKSILYNRIAIISLIFATISAYNNLNYSFLKNTKISNSLTIVISNLTLIILLFIFIPKKWLSKANIL